MHSLLTVPITDGALMIVQEREPLRDLVDACSEFTRDLRSVLDRLGRGKQAMGSGVTIATAIGEVRTLQLTDCAL